MKGHTVLLEEGGEEEERGVKDHTELMEEEERGVIQVGV